MKRVSVAVLLLVVLHSGLSVKADDYFPPYWRGYYGTVTAGWDYWGPAGLGPRTLLQMENQLVQANPGGLGDSFPAWAYFDSSVYVHDSLNGRTSVLEIPGSAAPVSHVGFRLSNYAGGELKYMRVQITFYLPGGGPGWFQLGAFPTDPGDPPWQFDPPISAVVTDSHYWDDGWQTNLYTFTFRPNPRYEGFSFIFPWDTTGFVDQVVIDTWCVPEPGSLMLAGVVALLVTRRRVR